MCLDLDKRGGGQHRGGCITTTVYEISKSDISLFIHYVSQCFVGRRFDTGHLCKSDSFFAGRAWQH